MQLGTGHNFKMATRAKMSPNFSLFLILSILQQEGNDVAANARKAPMWQSLAARLDAVYEHDRPWTAIRERWGQLMSAAEKAHQRLKTARAVIGGGVQPPPIPPHFKTVLNIWWWWWMELAAAMKAVLLKSSWHKVIFQRTFCCSNADIISYINLIIQKCSSFCTLYVYSWNIYSSREVDNDIPIHQKEIIQQWSRFITAEQSNCWRSHNDFSRTAFITTHTVVLTTSWQTL